MLKRNFNRVSKFGGFVVGAATIALVGKIAYEVARPIIVNKARLYVEKETLKSAEEDLNKK